MFISSQGKMLQSSSDLRAPSAKSRGSSAKPMSAKRELHGYDGPMQYFNKGNPDDMTTVQVKANRSDNDIACLMKDRLVMMA
jgi:hypothetical protein